jgi:hypothetical protein
MSAICIHLTLVKHQPTYHAPVYAKKHLFFAGYCFQTIVDALFSFRSKQQFQQQEAARQKNAIERDKLT